ncbi:uncharacterized protein PGTG_15981 [Puccinia graminis f. sp. tritici CRL 75-36-700-3]|uniref:Uncharacterized protein n=1 Tax=Puccinia graminis f. sp. tritici (strain CRL 75-36-700-3 / race SCCL) TaxID=418459 RepID=E3L0S9_PUCGT|nr:uncharacterized protein PGTG_15981 [Puccinia graminis f. sp. tritici CRL 75-36-700-3]EFP90133.1 hypothetical protein PGTG_15981 [Puccinia graminis f. sp. tritici CRL 75-36-700-3]
MGRGLYSGSCSSICWVRLSQLAGTLSPLCSGRRARKLRLVRPNLSKRLLSTVKLDSAEDWRGEHTKFFFFWSTRIDGLTERSREREEEGKRAVHVRRGFGLKDYNGGAVGDRVMGGNQLACQEKGLRLSPALHTHADAHKERKPGKACPNRTQLRPRQVEVSMEPHT